MTHESENGQQNSPRPQKPCRVCGKDIPRSARKCTECDSWQDWRAELGVSTTVLSLLIALISVVTASAPVIVGLLSTPNSELSFSFQRAELGASGEPELTALFSNQGARPGTIQRASIEFLHSGPKGTVEYLYDLLPPDGEPFLVEPSKSKIAKFRKSHAEGNNMDGSEKLVKCYVSFEYVNFVGTTMYDDEPVDCNRVATVEDVSTSWSKRQIDLSKPPLHLWNMWGKLYN